MSQVYGMGTITPLNYCPYPQHHSYILFNNAGQILGWKKKKITVTLCNFSGSAQSSWLNVDSLDIFHSSGTSPSSHLLKSFVTQAWSPMFNCAPADTLHFLTLLSASLLVLWPRWLIRLNYFLSYIYMLSWRDLCVHPDWCCLYLFLPVYPWCFIFIYKFQLWNYFIFLVSSFSPKTVFNFFDPVC